MFPNCYASLGHYIFLSLIMLIFFFVIKVRLSAGLWHWKVQLSIQWDIQNQLLIALFFILMWLPRSNFPRCLDSLGHLALQPWFCKTCPARAQIEGCKKYHPAQAKNNNSPNLNCYAQSEYNILFRHDLLAESMAAHAKLHSYVCVGPNFPGLKLESSFSFSDDKLQRADSLIKNGNLWIP